MGSHSLPRLLPSGGSHHDLASHQDSSSSLSQASSLASILLWSWSTLHTAAKEILIKSKSDRITALHKNLQWFPTAFPGYATIPTLALKTPQNQAPKLPSALCPIVALFQPHWPDCGSSNAACKPLSAQPRGLHDWKGPDSSWILSLSLLKGLLSESFLKPSLRPHPPSQHS